MATKKDLVEAYSFSRRRLVTAFVSGAPGGREVEPTRPGRTIIGGVAISVLLLAGAGVLGILGAPTAPDWSQEGLLSDEDSGADYVLIAAEAGGTPELRPVANITSAMLLFGPDVESRDVAGDEIASRTLGAPIGILEAPPTPPPSSSLIQTGWTACAGEGPGGPLGIRVDLSESPELTPAPSAGFVVASRGRVYLVAEATVRADRPRPRAYAYPVPDGASGDAVLQNVAGTSRGEAVEVPPDWLTLFPTGGSLAAATLGLPDDELGELAPYAGEGLVPRRARLGDVLTNGEDRYLLIGDGPVLLDGFATEVYDNLGTGVREREIGGPPGVATVETPALDWPSAPTAENTSRQVCGQLDTVAGEQPGVRLAIAPGADADATDVLVGETVIGVDSGHGAFVQRGDFDLRGAVAPTMVDVRGYAFPVAGDLERINLGYGEVADVVVPDSWLDLLPSGVPLSVDAARCPPISEARTRPCGFGR